MKLHLGCGNIHLEGYVNIDVDPKCNPDIVCDLENALIPGITENSVDEIFTHHCLEHIENIIPLMQYCYKILKPGHQFRIEVPSGHNLIWAMRDPTHKRLFFDQTFLYFIKTRYTPYYCTFLLVDLKRVKREVWVFDDNTKFEGEDINVTLQKPV